MWIFPIADTSHVLIRYYTPTGSAAAWGGQLLFDLVVFIPTLWKTVIICASGHGNLLDIFLRDGELSIFRFSLLLKLLFLEGCVYFGYDILVPSHLK